MLKYQTIHSWGTAAVTEAVLTGEAALEKFELNFQPVLNPFVLLTSFGLSFCAKILQVNLELECAPLTRAATLLMVR